MSDSVNQYLEYFETLTLETVDRLRDIVTEDYHFSDPFNDVEGVDKAIGIFEEMFHKVKDPRFTIRLRADSGDRTFVEWDFFFRSPYIKGGKEQRVQGVSLLRVNADGRISEHIDYWDSASQLYARLPVVGPLIRLLAKYFA